MTEQYERRASPFQPVLYALLLVFGIYIGKEWAASFRGGTGALQTLEYVLDRVNESYLTEVDRGALEELALESILGTLDPHSTYIDPVSMKRMAETMQGNFEGIGVEFYIADDTLMVVHALPSGPSELAGIQSGDCIVRVNGEEISGPDLTNDYVAALLKGPKGTKVQVGILRGSIALDFNLTRDKIAISSVVTSFALTESIGYVRITRFAGTTLAEFAVAMDKLEREGVNSVIVDLRGNGGGMLDAVIPMTELFLEEDVLVLSVEGENRGREIYRTTQRGHFADWPLAVIIDESSASASEIFAGAIQDNDRGIVVGRRSFGKGLVQEEFGLPNSGALRLTTARFHTPTGRAIQKPYHPGAYEAYLEEYWERYETGELLHADSMRQEHVADSLIYTTPEGRVVYGNGGITPDFFVPLDEVLWSEWIGRLGQKDVLRKTATSLVERFRKRSQKYGGDVGSQEHQSEVDDELIMACESQGLYEGENEPTSGEWTYAMNHFRAELHRVMYGEAAYYEFLAIMDEEVSTTRDLLLRYDEIEIVDGRLSLDQ